MNLNQLEYFVAVAESLNFTKAANKCYISQTAMTQQIKALEKNLGVELFNRDKHHVELTAAGQVYLNEAKAILDRTNEAARLARLVSEGVEGDITIGFINGYGQSDFPSILSKFHRAYPNIKIHLQKNNMSVLLNNLDKGDCDIVFAVSPRELNPVLNHKYLKSYPIMAAIPISNPLSSRDYLTYKDLENEDFIMMQPTNRTKDQMEESILIYERGGYVPNVVEIEGDQETLMLMISSNMGISILPEYITRPYQSDPRIKILPMRKQDGNAETIDLIVSWSKTNTNPALSQLLNCCDL